MSKQLPFDVGRFTIRKCQQTGGKAGKGHNKTSTIQVYYKRYYCVSKSFRYTVGDLHSFVMSIEKAKKYAELQIQKIKTL